MPETVTYEVLARLTPRQRRALYRVAKTRMRPWFADPKHMIRLRVAIAEDEFDREDDQ